MLVFQVVRCRGVRRFVAAAAIALGLSGLTGPALADTEEAGGLGLSAPIASGLPGDGLAFFPPVPDSRGIEVRRARRPGITRIDLQAGLVPLGSGPRALQTPTLGEVVRDVEWREGIADQIWGPANTFPGF